MAIVSAQTLTMLASFSEFRTNGALPTCTLIQASDGNFYGTTSMNGNGQVGGTIFKMTPNGTLTTLVNLGSASGFTNGYYPYAGLLQVNGGSFYGTTFYGTTIGPADGTIFKMTADGLLTRLDYFVGTNGAYPYANLIQANDGNFYGTTESGGDLSTNSDYNYGTIFKMTPAGVLTTLVNFNYTNGAAPYASLIQASDGNFYGTTASGGTNNSGTIFKMSPAGALTTLVNFNSTNGAAPHASLIQASDGNFYGTTESGGTNNSGTIFKMSPDGTLATLVIFDNTNGAYPYASLIQASDGNFYGTTVSGGPNGAGTIFKMSPIGSLTTLVYLNFGNAYHPQGSLMQANDGNLYGTTEFGDASGTIFKITGLNLLPSFQSITLTNGNVNLAWNSVSNWTYRVQYKINLTDTYWADLPEDVLATNVISSKTDIAVPTQRFYRLLLLR